MSGPLLANLALTPQATTPCNRTALIYNEVIEGENMIVRRTVTALRRLLAVDGKPAAKAKRRPPSCAEGRFFSVYVTMHCDPTGVSTCYEAYNVLSTYEHSAQ
jgi:hypothetical protein